MRRLATPLILAPILAAALAGCHAPPRIELSRAEPLEQTEQGRAVRFDLAATNRNRFELPLLTISYELWLEGERVFEGRRSGEATLRREGTQMLRLPAAVPLAPGAPARAGRAPFRLRGTINYQTPGALSRSLFDARLVRPSTSFDLRGEIDFGAPASAPDPGSVPDGADAPVDGPGADDGGGTADGA